MFDVTLPDEVQEAYDRDHDSVRASYRFEIVAALRASQWQLHRRVVRENSAINRTYDELFPKDAAGKRAPSRENSPHLFSLFLDPTKSQKRHQSVAFAFDVAILVPDYEIDGVLWLKKHFEGGYLVRKLIVVEAFVDDSTPSGWRLEYGIQSETPNDTSTMANARLEDGALKFEIPIASPDEVAPRRHRPAADRDPQLVLSPSLPDRAGPPAGRARADVTRTNRRSLRTIGLMGDLFAAAVDRIISCPFQAPTARSSSSSSTRSIRSRRPS